MIVQPNDYFIQTKKQQQQQHWWCFSLAIAALSYLCRYCFYEPVKDVVVALVTMVGMSSAARTSTPPASPCPSSSPLTSWRRYVGTTSSPILPQNKRAKKAGDRHDDEFHRQELLGRQSTCNNNNNNDNNNSPAGDESKVAGVSRMIRRRPSRIVVPEAFVACAGFGGEADEGPEEIVVEGDGYCLASKKGKKKLMEDGHGVMTNINGDPMQAYFGVFDGHGGNAAVDFVSKTLGKNIVTALIETEKSGYSPNMAIRSAYLTTDQEFLRKNLESGVCAATVLIKDGKIYIANVGDCRIVMSRRSGLAQTLTIDHRPEIIEERSRIEKSGGYVYCHNGVWRVQGSLSVSRAIGDLRLKNWIISEPETNAHRLTADCDFLIIASDGLWYKVTDQEAVDLVLKHRIDGVRSCKALVDASWSRGCRDDITVMVVDLTRFSRDG